MSSVEHIRAKVLEIISKHDADKIDTVDILMKKWKGKENYLLKTLCEKYKEKYVKMEALHIKRIYSIGHKFGYDPSWKRKCKRRKDGVVFALNVINKRYLNKDKLLRLESEINIMRQISHENIIKLHDIFDSRSKICLILDLIEGEQLFDGIIGTTRFCERDAASIFRQICQGLQYLHSRSIVHNHLKPENILFVTKQATGLRIKLIDFSLAVSCKYHDTFTSMTRYERDDYDYYIAPENLEKHKYDTQSDMWSIGVILYIILCGFPPFHHEISSKYDEYVTFGFIRESQQILSHQTKNNSFYIIPQPIILLCLQFCGNCCNQSRWFIQKRLYKKIKCAQYYMPSPFWDDISKNAKDLIEKLLKPDPKKRLTASYTLQHEWLKANESVKELGCYQLLHLKRFQYIHRLRRGIKRILALSRMMEALQS